MTVFDKKLESFLHNPKSVSYKDIEKIMIWVGFEKIQAKGSHVKFKNYKREINFVVPVHGGECKDFYKKEIQKIIKTLL